MELIRDDEYVQRACFYAHMVWLWNDAAAIRAECQRERARYPERPEELVDAFIRAQGAHRPRVRVLA